MVSEEKMMEGEVNIKLTGTLSIYEVSDVRKNLLKVFDNNEPVVIDLEDINHCDTAGVQLLISAKKTAEKNGNSFVISSISRAVHEAAEDTGIELDKAETISGGYNVKSNNDDR